MGTSEVSCLPSDTSNNSIRRYTDHSSSENERHLENSHASRAQTELPSLQMTNSQMRWSYPNQALADQLPNKSSCYKPASTRARTLTWRVAGTSCITPHTLRSKQGSEESIRPSGAGAASCRMLWMLMDAVNQSQVLYKSYKLS
ncbi:hypothetical protein H671_5g14430 [Cricetulus griseus]|nr:hypothetical protein H671_5g14430 [Cricetulus griseus]